MPALNGAFAFDERHDGAVMISEQLHFDMTRPRQLALEIHGWVAERGGRLRSCRADGARKVGRVDDGPHAFAAAAGHRLHQQRIADRLRRRRDLLACGVGAKRIFRPGHDGNAGAFRRAARRRLAAHRFNRASRRTDESESRADARGREVLILGKEAVAGMHRIGAAAAGRIDEAIDAQIALPRGAGSDGVRFVGEPHVKRRAIALGVDRHGRQIHLAARADDAHGNLAPVCDQDFLHENTPLYS